VIICHSVSVTSCRVWNNVIHTFIQSDCELSFVQINFPRNPKEAFRLRVKRVKCGVIQIKILSKFLEWMANGLVGIYMQCVSLNYIGYRDNSNVLITI